MNFNIFNSLILAGVIQGFLFGGVWLFNKKYKGRSTNFLIALILVYSLSNLQYYLLDVGAVTNRQFYSYLYIGWPLLMPVLLLFYGLLLIDPDRAITPRQTLLYLPFAGGLILGLIYKFQVVILEKDPDFSKFFGDLVAYGEALAILFSIGVFAYLLLKISKFEKTQTFSSKKITPHLQWFKYILITLCFSTVLWAYSEFGIGYGTENYYFYPLWIVVAIITYWLGHVGIYKYGVNRERKNIRDKIFHRVPRITEAVGKSEHLDSLEHFLVEERNFMNPGITLETTANALGISKGHLSRVINNELNIGFKEHLNGLRVEEAKSYLLDPDFSNYTLVAIGLEAGFNSKSAFNAAFKKATGMTPSEFKKKHTP
ncbi:MAG: helix-turn-helix domain-containing protein [Bacteroidota bacterium]